MDTLTTDSLKLLAIAAENLSGIVRLWGHGGHYGQHEEDKCSYCEKYMIAIRHLVRRYEEYGGRASKPRPTTTKN